jgi:hypothetical protein
MAPSVKFDFIDSRPSDQKVTGITGDAFGTVITLGDDAIRPASVEVFKGMLAQRLGMRLEGQTIRLEQFAVQIFMPHRVRNDQLDSLRASAAGVVNPLGEILTRFAQLGFESMQTKNLVGTRISGRINDRDFFMRHDEGFRKISEGDVHTVIAKAINGAVADIVRVAEMRSNSTVETDAKLPPI